MNKICPNCNSLLEFDQRFCNNCGTKIEDKIDHLMKNQSSDIVKNQKKKFQFRRKKVKSRVVHSNVRRVSLISLIGLAFLLVIVITSIADNPIYSNFNSIDSSIIKSRLSIYGLFALFSFLLVLSSNYFANKYGFDDKNPHLLRALGAIVFYIGWQVFLSFFSTSELEIFVSYRSIIIYEMLNFVVLILLVVLPGLESLYFARNLRLVDFSKLEINKFRQFLLIFGSWLTLLGLSFYPIFNTDGSIAGYLSNQYSIYALGLIVAFSAFTYFATFWFIRFCQGDLTPGKLESAMAAFSATFIICFLIIEYFLLPTNIHLSIIHISLLVVGSVFMLIFSILDFYTISPDEIEDNLIDM